LRLNEARNWGDLRGKKERREREACGYHCDTDVAEVVMKKIIVLEEMGGGGNKHERGVGQKGKGNSYNIWALYLSREGCAMKKVSRRGSEKKKKSFGRKRRVKMVGDRPFALPEVCKAVMEDENLVFKSNERGVQKRKDSSKWN